MNQAIKNRMTRETRLLTPAQRMERFDRLQRQCWLLMSEEGRQRFERRNRRKRRIHRAEYGIT